MNCDTYQDELSERKKAILTAFEHLVGRFGVKKTAMQDVAKEVGVSVGVIYKDFANKEELVDFYMAKLIHDILSNCQIDLNQDKPTERLLYEFLCNYFNTLNNTVRNHLIFRQFWTNNIDYGLLQMFFRYKEKLLNGIAELLQEIMEKGVKDGSFEIENPEIASRLFLKALHTYTMDLIDAFDSDDNLNERLKSLEPELIQMYSFLLRAIVKK